MSRLVPLVVALLLLGAPLLANDRTEVADSVAMLYDQYDSGGMMMTCTATAFKPTRNFAPKKGGRLFLTAAHCVSHVDNGRQSPTQTPFFVSTDEPDKKVYARATIIAIGKLAEGYDFAVLEADLPLPELKLGNENDEKSGNEVINVAAPRGIGKAYYRGYISVLKVDRTLQLDEGAEWVGAMVVQIPSEGGSSGSVLVSVKSGEIIGVLVGSSKAVTIAIPISKISAVDRKHLLSPPQEGPNDPTHPSQPQAPPPPPDPGH